MPIEDSEETRWFSEEVRPCEPVLRAYLRNKFPSLSDLDDVVQESYLRLYRARIEGKLRSVRGFLFTTARNVAFDVFRRRQTISIEEIVEMDLSPVWQEGAGVAEIVNLKQELGLLAEAIEALPSRCRQVLKLRKIYGLSHKEIAARMGISERTVNVQIGLGVRRCAEYLRGRGVVAGDGKV